MWDTLILNPMINALLLLYDLLGNNFILAITVFTVLIRLLTLPLSLRQQRSMAKTQELQPQIQAIQKKYKDNPQRMQEEFQKIGYNPADTLTGCLPMLVQFPVLIGLYQAILVVLGSTPQALFELTQRVYDGINLTELLPVDNTFAWLNLAQPDPLFVLPLLVFASMFVQQKLLTPTPAKTSGSDNNPAAAMTQSMQYTMPIMFGFFSLQFPAGLSIYFVLSNLIGMAQGFYTRNIQNKEKAEREGKKETAVVGNGSVADDEIAADVKEPKATKADTSDGDNRRSKKRSTSKRKRRSAKR